MGSVVSIHLSMNCPECGSVLAEDSARCERCGTDLARTRPPLTVAKATAPSPAGPAAPRDEIKLIADWGFVLDREFDRLYRQFKEEEGLKQQEREREVLWGGFMRRSLAFSVDLVVLFCLSLILSYASYAAYQVGLAAYGRTVFDDPVPLLRVALVGSLFLAAGYFVLFHGMDGRTIGKWLLRLRVVDRNQDPITYTQALVRFIGYGVSAFFGLGFLWVMLNRKKRGWHDLLAHTWVIRESSFQDKGK